MYRCMHGVPPLSWSNELAQIAQQWADKFTGTLVHNSGRGVDVGENLYGGSESIYGPVDPIKGVDVFYKEIEQANRGLVSSFSGSTGHYTQVVWRSTTEVGCAKANGELVCNYRPTGNMLGQFDENVNSPVKTESECR